MICRIYDVEGGTLEDYDTVITRVGLERPERAHTHIAGRTERGLRVIEVWDSPEDAERCTKEGVDRAMEDTNICLSQAGLRPTITEFEVHHLDWLG